jgi:hypothetical protein
VYDSLYDFFVFVHFTGFMLMAGCMRSFAMRTSLLSSTIAEGVC